VKKGSDGLFVFIASEIELKILGNKTRITIIK
jgi:hypothetical protein